MAHDDSTWVIHSLPRARPDAPDRAQAPRHAFQSVLSPWRGDERPREAVGEGRRGPVRNAG